MSGSSAVSVDSYLSELTDERRELVSLIRNQVLASLDDGFEEIIDFGMISYVVPLERYPETYNGHPLMFAAIASQKRYVSLYLMSIYADPDAEKWFSAEYAKSGRKPDMGKSCVRFRKPEDLPLELIGQAIAKDTPDTFIATLERATSEARARRSRA